MEIPPKDGKHNLNCVQQVGPKVISQWLPHVHEPLQVCLIMMECRKPVKR